MADLDRLATVLAGLAAAVTSGRLDGGPIVAAYLQGAADGVRATLRQPS